ncbi:MAG: PLP-dependent aminotransferase family protein, partial [Lachnospiraceae bacterium]|nr:PLP-dependent aminotransferase family protein [Lachnospiraceae bacterium]
MPTYQLDKRGKKPLYEYLYECLKNDIRSGVLPGNQRLPSKREMARDHGVAVVTVENAYAQLLAEGYLYTRPRSGFYVTEGLERETAGSAADAPGREGDRIAEDAPGREGTPRASRAASDGTSRSTGNGDPTPKKEYFVDFTSGRIHSDAFPYAAWARLMRRVLTDREEDFLIAPPREGVYPLRKAIADYLQDARHLTVSPDRIIVGPGTEYLHSILLRLIGGSDPVAVEDPGYSKIGLLYESTGRPTFHVRVDREGICIEPLRKNGVRLVHTSPSHHFPTGCVMSAERRKQLVKWALSEDAYIVEDDYDSEFRFSGRPIATLTESNDTNVIYMNTFTRTLAPSIRIAYMVLPEALMERYRTLFSFYSGAVSSPEQFTLAAFLSEGYYQRHISRMRTFYRTRREQVLEAFSASALSGYAELTGDSAGLHFILLIKRDLNDKKFIKDLDNVGIRINPLALYCYNDAKPYAHAFLLGYG